VERLSDGLILCGYCRDSKGGLASPDPTFHETMTTRSLLTLLVALATPCAAQSDLDSLLRIWNDPTQHDSVRVLAYKHYVWDGFLFSRPDTAYRLAEAMHAYARQHDYRKAASNGHQLQGIADQLQGNSARAMDHYLKELEIDEAMGDEPRTASTLDNIGSLFLGQGNYPMALDYYQKALEMNERIANKNGIAVSLNNIGIVQQVQHNYTRALEHYQKARELNEELGNDQWLTNNLNNIGVTYQKLADHARALEYYQKAGDLIEKLGMKKPMADNLANIGIVYADQGEYALALDHFRRSRGIQEEIGDRSGLASSLNNIGLVHLKLGDEPMALDHCRKSLVLGEELGAVRQQEQACKCLYDAYKALGDDGNALRYYEQMVAHRDSMFNEESTKKLTQLEMQYEFDKKEAATTAEQEKKDAVAAQELKRQKLVRNGIGGGLAFALLFLGVVWRQRNRIGREKARSEELLLNILPEEVAEELKAKGSAEAVHIDQVSVLFTDFKGFTAMSEVVTPQELVRDLNECFSAFDRITEKYGIEKIKTIGDAYMAAGGLPTPNTTHANDVINAALEMRDLIAEGKARKIAAGLPFFEVRIGIHTGPVVAGIVGVKKFQYDIWGDTVNTASRMESSGEVGQVNISEATYALVKDVPEFTFTPRGKVQAKGKGELAMYFVERSTPTGTSR